MSFFFFFFFNDTATTEIYTLSLHDALPNFAVGAAVSGENTSMSVSALAPPVVEYGVTSSSCVSANADGTIPSAPARSARKISFLTWRDPFCWTTSSRDVALTSVGRRARRDLVPRTGDLSGAPATTGAPLESSLVPLLDPGERVLAARERARDAGRVALLEPCVHVGRLVGRDRARQACDGDRG